MRHPCLIAGLSSLIFGCHVAPQVEAPEVVSKPDSRLELAEGRAAFENNLVVDEKFETFDRLGSMSLGLPSSAVYYPFGESDHRFVLILYENHRKLLYQQLRGQRPETIWHSTLKPGKSSAGPGRGSLVYAVERDGYQLPKLPIPKGVEKELRAQRGYAGYALMGAVDTLVVFTIGPDGTMSKSHSVSPNPLSAAKPMLPITPGESDWLGFGKSFFMGEGEFNVMDIPEG